MLIRSTSIIAHSLVEGDLRQFTHTLNQQPITDTDSIIPITHKGQLTQINRKDLSEGMSPWSAYHRDWLTSFTLDLDHLRQGITWYREVDDDGVLHSYWFKWSAGQSEYYNELLAHFGTGLRCETVGRYTSIVGMTASPHPWTRYISEGILDTADGENAIPTQISQKERESISQSISRLLWLLLVYGTIQQTNGICTALKINLPVTWYTRSQMQLLQEDCTLLRNHGLFVQWYLVGTGIKQNLELVTNDAELLQLLLSHLQYIDSSITMTTFDTLYKRSIEVIQWQWQSLPLIAKPRTLW